jgi:hypothetical protein
MPRIAPSNTGRTPMERLMGHAPHILDPWTKLEDAFFASKTFSPALLEQVRRTLALGTGFATARQRAVRPIDRRPICARRRPWSLPSTLHAITAALTKQRSPAHAITSQMGSYVSSSCSWASCGRAAHSVRCSDSSRCVHPCDQVPPRSPGSNHA